MADRLVDGRCRWGASSPDYVAYHDEESGGRVHDHRGLYERMCLEAFQSGLSWLTILRKREAFRAAFAGLRAGQGRRVRRRRRRTPAGRRRDRAQPGEDRRGDRQRERGRRRATGRWPSCCGRSRRTERPSGRDLRRRAGRHARVDRDGEGAQAPRLPLRRADHRLRADAGVRARQRPPGRMPGEVTYSGCCRRTRTRRRRSCSPRCARASARARSARSCS